MARETMAQRAFRALVNTYRFYTVDTLSATDTKGTRLTVRVAATGERVGIVAWDYSTNNAHAYALAECLRSSGVPISDAQVRALWIDANGRRHFEIVETR
jgi:hypothetical protein